MAAPFLLDYTSFEGAIVYGTMKDLHISRGAALPQKFIGRCVTDKRKRVTKQSDETILRMLSWMKVHPYDNNDMHTLQVNDVVTMIRDSVECAYVYIGNFNETSILCRSTIDPLRYMIVRGVPTAKKVYQLHFDKKLTYKNLVKAQLTSPLTGTLIGSQSFTLTTEMNAILCTFRLSMFNRWYTPDSFIFADEAGSTTAIGEDDLHKTVLQFLMEKSPALANDMKGVITRRFKDQPPPLPAMNPTAPPDQPSMKRPARNPIAPPEQPSMKRARKARK